MIRVLLRRAAAGAAACLSFLLAAGCAHAPAAAPPVVPVLPAAASAPPVLRELATGLPRSGQWRNGFDLADLDGDGRLDLLHPPARKRGGPPVVFLGDGAGGFERWEGVSFPERRYDYGAAVAGDWDGDGRADLALAIHLHGLVALRQAAPGEFVDVSAGLPWGAGGFSARTLAAADWDGDGRSDLVALGEGPVRFGAAGGATGLAVFLNRGSSWVATGPGPEGGFGDALAVGDVDGDGRPDAVVPLADAPLYLGSASGWRRVAVQGLPARAVMGAVAVADVDRDGRDEALLTTLEPASGDWSWALHLLDWRAGAAEVRRLAGGSGKVLIRAAAIDDLDGDGGLEAVLLDGDGALRVVPLARPEEAVVVPAPAWRAGCSGYGLALGDLTGDGRLEIVASFAGEGSTFEDPGTCASGGGFDAWAVAAAP